MGNSPSRNELQVQDHMSNIVNNSSGQETFQSHSYPAKFPGIHDTRTTPVTPTAAAQHGSNLPPANKNGSRGSSGGPNTPDLLYSMDSLNVCGNNSTSITSAELPPSSISPANGLDPWRREGSSFSDESLFTQRQHTGSVPIKDKEGLYRHRAQSRTPSDEALTSSSTYESDSLNPDATLSGMVHEPLRKDGRMAITNRASKQHPTLLRREQSPGTLKPEIAEEATEILPPEGSTTPTYIDHSITINGRKVSTCEETPLPIIAGLQKHAERINTPDGGGGGADSKVGSSSAARSRKSSPPLLSSSNPGANGIYSTGTIKRGRMKSPPPPPPPSKANAGSIFDNASSVEKAPAESCDKMSTLNLLMRRNCPLDNRNGLQLENAEERPASVHDRLEGDIGACEMSVTPSQRSPSVCETSSGDSELANEKRSECSSSSEKCVDKGKSTCSLGEQLVESVIKQENPSSEEEAGPQEGEQGAPVDTLQKEDAQIEKASLLPSDAALATHDKVNTANTPTEIAIRPCESSTESQGDSERNASEGRREEQMRPLLLNQAQIEVGVGLGHPAGMVSAQMQHVEDTATDAVARDDEGKTELDCKDAERDCGALDTGKPVCGSENVTPDEKKKADSFLFDEDISVAAVAGLHGSTSEDGGGANAGEVNVGATQEPVMETAVEFPEMSDSQLDTSFGSRTAPHASKMMQMFEFKDRARGSRSEHWDSKVASDNKEQQRSGKRGTWSRESTPPASSPVVVTTETGMPLLPEMGGNRSGSNCSSRRGSLSSSSSASFVELSNGTAAASTGILNCNRMSLCSLPDNEMDVDNFESPPPPVLDSETIRAQPLAWRSPTNSESPEAPMCGSEEKIIESEAVDGVTVPISNGSSQHYGHQRKSSVSKIDFDCNTVPEKRFVVSSAPVASLCTSPKSNVSRKTSFPELFVNTSPSQAHSEGRSCIERRFSVGSTETKSRHSQLRRSCQNIMTTSVETETDISNVGRRTKFAKNDFLQTLGEIYACKSKLLKSKSQQPPSLAADPPPQENLKSNVVMVVTSPVSSCLSTADGRTGVSLEAVARSKAKSRESSIDTVDGFECQDRSISEYNISPRSARQLVSGSLLPNGCSPSNNASSKSAALPMTLSSQVSIVTVDEKEGSPVRTLPPTLAVPLSTPFNGAEGIRKSTDISDALLPGLVTQSTSLSNGAPPIFSSGTYRKKSNFNHPRDTGNKGDTVLSEMELCESLQSSSSPSNAEEKGACFPAPPPMPPLQYSHQSSSSSSFDASSTLTTTSFSLLGDSSSDSLSKGRSPCFPVDNEQPLNSSNGSGFSKLTCRSSPDRTGTSKATGNCATGNSSVECSLVELSLANKRSTSDAIIVELKKAQAKKLGKFTGRKSSDSDDHMSEKCHNSVDSPDRKGEVVAATVAFVQVAPPPPGVQEQTRQWSHRSSATRQASDEKINGLSENKGASVVSVDHRVTDNSPGGESPTRKDVGEPPVKAIINGKHTNSIIVNETPTSASGPVGKRESLLRRPALSGIARAGGSVCGGKTQFAEQRGHIMSPSLSGNYKEMNGIDSETMGASSNHEDEVSGQLQQQQKDNHINNENDGNVVVDEVQTSNKLDGASFRRVLSEYEKTLSMFIQQIDQLKQRMDDAETEKQTLIKERDQALEDLRNVESAFSDVHRKYERAKALLENMKSNEDTLIRRDHEMMQRIQNRDKKIEMIKEKAQESIEKMHLDYETRIKEMDFENAKLRAQYRKMEMKLSTLENDVEQKAKENAQLSALCDELINGQVGQV